MIIIYNSKYGIVYGEKQFYDFFGFTPSIIIEKLDKNNLNSTNNFSDKLYINNNYYNVFLELLYKNEIFEWLINVKEICCNLTQIEFNVNKELIISDFQFEEGENSNGNSNCSSNSSIVFESNNKGYIIFEGKHLKDFDNDVYMIVLDHINTKKTSLNNVYFDEKYLFVDTTFCGLFNKEYLVYILYDINKDIYKVICKTIADFLKEKNKNKS